MIYCLRTTVSVSAHCRCGKSYVYCIAHGYYNVKTEKQCRIENILFFIFSETGRAGASVNLFARSKAKAIWTMYFKSFPRMYDRTDDNEVPYKHYSRST